MSKNRISENSLLRNFFVTILKFYRHKVNQTIKFYYCIFFIKKLKVFFYQLYMEIQEIKKLEKNLVKYFCEHCDFKCFQKCDWERHIMRPKHTLKANGKLQEIKNLKKPFTCICGKFFKTNAGLWKHQKKCSIINQELLEVEEVKPNPASEDEIKILTNLVLDVVKQNKELTEQNKELTEKIVEICKSSFQSNISHSNINSNNNTFNLQFFLNETCKNAMNITDFIDSIKLQLSDLENVGKLGYVEGISNIIVNNLNALDENVRPIHCTDKKRETFYVKDKDQWEKEDEERKKIKNIINKIADKNIRLLPQFREKYPEYSNSSSRISDKYDKMVIEVMDTDLDKKDKIIKNIAKKVTIDKCINID
jgi:hypothetical protein